MAVYLNGSARLDPEHEVIHLGHVVQGDVLRLDIELTGADAAPNHRFKVEPSGGGAAVIKFVAEEVKVPNPIPTATGDFAFAFISDNQGFQALGYRELVVTNVDTAEVVGRVSYQVITRDDHGPQGLGVIPALLWKHGGWVVIGTIVCLTLACFSGCFWSLGASWKQIATNPITTSEEDRAAKEAEAYRKQVEDGKPASPSVRGLAPDPDEAAE